MSSISKLNWSSDQIKKEVSTGEVKTIPNNAQNIREILFRNTNGMSYDNYKTPYYEEQATFSSKALNKIQDMEPTEKMQFLDTLRSESLALKNKIKGFEDEKAALIAQQEAEKAAIEKVEAETKK